MNQKYKILIAGDSWGCGEWKGDPMPAFILPNGRSSHVIHYGLEQYLLDDGHIVKNISIPGANNEQVIDKLNDHINEMPWDYIFWFQTDPLRTFRDTTPQDYTTYNKWFNDYEHLINIQNNYLDSIYNALNQMNKPIYCIGGCSKINKNLLLKYKNLHLLIESVMELLIENFIQPNLWFSSDWYQQLDERWNLDTIDKILDDRRKCDSLKEMSPHFYKDSGHPDREGHEKIFNFIKMNLFNF